MKKFIVLILILFAFGTTKAQYVHKIKADSVLITNDSCTAELIIENSTKEVKGFLYNRGKGRTEFRKAEQLSDSSFIIAGDTIVIRGTSNSDSSGLWQLNTSNNLIPKPFSGTRVEVNKPLYFLGSSNRIHQYIKLPSTQTMDTPIVKIVDHLDSSIFELRGHYAIHNGVYTSSLYIGKDAGKKIAVGSVPNAGSDNTAMGFEAMSSLLIGRANTSFGSRALKFLRTGFYNSAFGPGTLMNLDSGSDNTVIGQLGMYGLTSGDFNVALGVNTAQNHTGGNNNVFIGALSGYSVSNSISGSVFLGNRAGFYESASNRLHIANAPTTTPLIYGEFDNSVLSISPTNAKFGIRTLTPSQALHIKGQVQIDTLTTGASTDSVLVVNNGLVKKVLPNQTNAFLLDRANHTGTQAQSTIDGLTELLSMIPRRVLYQTTRLSHTGNTTETEIYRDTIKHSVHPFGPNSSLHIPFVSSSTTSTNTRIIRIKINGTTVAQITSSTAANGTWRGYAWLSNRNSLTDQVAGGTLGAGSNLGFAASTASPIPGTYTIDTSGDVIVTATAQLANSAERQSLEQMDVILYP